MASSQYLDNLPFANVAENVILDNNKFTYNSLSHHSSTNYDNLADIDPDINNISLNNLNKQCKAYDTSFEFNREIGPHNNIALLHTNICSSSKKLKDFMYYIDNLDTIFHFIGVSETWATKSNEDLLNIPNFSHVQCIRSNGKKAGGVSLYVHSNIQFKIREDLSLPKKIYESIFIEVDKSIFKTNRNIIIGEIYNPPSSKLKCFITNLKNTILKRK